MKNLAPYDEHLPPGEPWRRPDIGNASTHPARYLFDLEPFADITFTGREEWMVKSLLPAQGLAVVYGPSGCGKSFLITDLALAVARGEPWAGKRVTPGPVVYIAAEGAVGFRKRIAAYRDVNGLDDANLPFFLISAVPNLGIESGDLDRLRESIEAQRLEEPLRLIVIDTLAQVLHGAEENGVGMMALIGNANALTQHFRCAVLVIHHSGKNSENGSRGHSSLPAAADVVWSVKKDENSANSVMTIEKAKDEVGGLAFAFQLGRRVLAIDEDGDEISSLVVSRISETGPTKPRKSEGKKKPPASANLLMACIRESVDTQGRNIRPLADGPMVRGISEDRIRDLYYERMGDKSQSTKRSAFWRGIDRLIERQDIAVGEISGERCIWLP